MQTDPVGYEDQMNLYAYVGNDPVNMVDPTGNSMATIHLYQPAVFHDIKALNSHYSTMSKITNGAALAVLPYSPKVSALIGIPGTYFSSMELMTSSPSKARLISELIQTGISSKLKPLKELMKNGWGKLGLAIVEDQVNGWVNDNISKERQEPAKNSNDDGELYERSLLGADQLDPRLPWNEETPCRRIQLVNADSLRLIINLIYSYSEVFNAIKVLALAKKAI